MTAASGIKAGEAYVEIHAKLDALRAELKKGRSEIGGFGKSLEGIGKTLAGAFAGFSVGAALKMAVTEFANVASTINDMAARTGLATDQLQELKFAAGQTGASLDDVEKAARNMVKKGFSVASFEDIGQAIAGIQDPSERARKALEVFGKTGTRLLPMFAEIKSLKEMSRGLGPILSAEDVVAGDRLGDAFSAMGEAASRLKQQIGAGLAPKMQDMLHTAIGISAEFSEWIKGKRSPGQESDTSFGSGKFDPGENFRKWLGNVKFFQPDSPIGQWLKKKTEEGAKATEASARMSKAQRLADFEPEDEKAAKRSADAMRKARVKAIEDANDRRASLVKQFQTPEQEFASNMQAIMASIRETAMQQRAGMFGTGAGRTAPISALYQALDNLVAEERKRRSDLLDKSGRATDKKSDALISEFGTEKEKFVQRMKELREELGSAKGMERVMVSEAMRRLQLFEQGRLAEEAQKAIGSSKGTFSSAAAGLLGHGGEAADLKEARTHTGILRRIEQNTAKGTGARFT